MNELGILRVVLLAELRRLVRDRRAVFSAVVLPALLYPFILWGTGEVDRISEETLQAQEVRVALAIEESAGPLADELRHGLQGATPIHVWDVDATPVFEAEATLLEEELPQVRQHRMVEAFEEVTDGSADLLVVATAHPEVPERMLVRLWYDVQQDSSREAYQRARQVCSEIDERAVLARRAQLLGDDPARGLDVTVVDVASDEDRGGDLLGRLLPMMVVLILVSGGAYAALAVFAGEREQGTLETLLVQPVPVRAVTYGKFGAVFLAGIVTVGVNLGSLALCTASGLTGSAGEGVDIGLGRAVLALAYLPGCLLICAVLCLVCGRARSFRAGQHAVLPVTLFTALPTAIVLQPDLVHSPLLAMIPLSGAALSLRDALRGDLTLWTTVVMVISHLGWSALVLARLAHLLEPERSLHGSDEHRERPDARIAIGAGYASLLVFYLVGTRLQAWDLEAGLILSLAVLLPTLAVATGWLVARRRHEPLVRQFWLAPPHPLAMVGALLLTPALTQLVMHLLEYQQRFLPLPSSMAEGSEALSEALFGGSLAWALVLVALLPAVFEEFLFRGTLLPALRRDLRPVPAALWSAGLFAAMHLSLHRLLPTFTIGLVCAAIVLRTRSLWPAVLVHLVHNGSTVLGASDAPWDLRLPAWVHQDPAWAFGLVPLALVCLHRGSASRVRDAA